MEYRKLKPNLTHELTRKKYYTKSRHEITDKKTSLESKFTIPRGKHENESHAIFS